MVSKVEPSARAVVAALRSRARTHAALAAQLKSFAVKGGSALEEKVSGGTGNVELCRCGWCFGLVCVCVLCRSAVLHFVLACWWRVRWNPVHIQQEMEGVAGGGGGTHCYRCLRGTHLV